MLRKLPPWPVSASTLIPPSAVTAFMVGLIVPKSPDHWPYIWRWIAYSCPERLLALIISHITNNGAPGNYTASNLQIVLCANIFML